MCSLGMPLCHSVMQQAMSSVRVSVAGHGRPGIVRGLSLKSGQSWQPLLHGPRAVVTGEGPVVVGNPQLHGQQLLLEVGVDALPHRDRVSQLLPRQVSLVLRLVVLLQYVVRPLPVRLPVHPLGRPHGRYKHLICDGVLIGGLAETLAIDTHLAVNQVLDPLLLFCVQRLLAAVCRGLRPGLGCTPLGSDRGCAAAAAAAITAGLPARLVLQHLQPPVLVSWRLPDLPPRRFVMRLLGEELDGREHQHSTRQHGAHVGAPVLPDAVHLLLDVLLRVRQGIVVPLAGPRIAQDLICLCITLELGWGTSILVFVRMVLPRHLVVDSFDLFGIRAFLQSENLIASLLATPGSRR
mmetsp:Transcript_18693/g.56528  ORF Transcript_18693/g.56528 Transcript_18693/m.56528 type:complete len:351 (+) Transcript_18693:154-1206(+)